MRHRIWTVAALEKRIAEGESLLAEFAHNRECFDLVRRELDKKQGMLAKLRAENLADRSVVSHSLPNQHFGRPPRFVCCIGVAGHLRSNDGSLD